MSNSHGTTGFRVQSLAPLTAALLAAIAVGACGTDEELSEGQVAESEARPLVGTYVGTLSESPKLMRRSSMYEQLPPIVRHLVGRGLTDHPTTD